MTLVEDLERINAGREAAAEFIRKHQKVKGGVGFGDTDPNPLVIETVEVRGQSIQIKTKNGIKNFIPKARIVTLADGSVQVIAGGLGTQVSVEDARKILGTKEKIKLTKSLTSKVVVK